MELSNECRNVDWLTFPPGPAIVMDRTLLPFWDGMDEAAKGESVYEVAYRGNELCFEVKVHNNPAVILWQESLPLKVLRDDSMTYIVRALSTEVALDELDVAIDPCIMFGKPFAKLICKEELVIFHAALKGCEWEIMGRRISDITASVYSVDTALQSNVHSSLVIHRLSTVD